jgi:hypothetical protein
MNTNSGPITGPVVPLLVLWWGKQSAIVAWNRARRLIHRTHRGGMTWSSRWISTSTSPRLTGGRRLRSPPVLLRRPAVASDAAAWGDRVTRPELGVLGMGSRAGRPAAVASPGGRGGVIPAGSRGIGVSPGRIGAARLPEACWRRPSAR